MSLAANMPATRFDFVLFCLDRVTKLQSHIAIHSQDELLTGVIHYVYIIGQTDWLHLCTVCHGIVSLIADVRRSIVYIECLM